MARRKVEPTIRL